MSELSDLLLNEKPARALIEIKNQSEPYGSSISSNIDTTYAHTNKILSKIESLEDPVVLESEELSRKKIYSLTDEGREIANALEVLCKVIGAEFVDGREGVETEGKKIGEVLSE